MRDAEIPQFAEDHTENVGSARDSTQYIADSQDVMSLNIAGVFFHKAPVPGICWLCDSKKLKKSLDLE